MRPPHVPEPPGGHDGVPKREVGAVDDDGRHVARLERDGGVEALGRDRDAVALVGADEPGGRVWVVLTIPSSVVASRR